MNFNQALTTATEVAVAKLADLREDVILVRDLQGRIRLLLKKSRDPNSEFYPHIQSLVQDVSTALGDYAYPPADLVMYRDKLRQLGLPDASEASFLADNGTYKVCLHDRLLTGTEWNTEPAQEDPRRFTLFSMKGGVGRSTTAVVLARHLATKGKRVLILDMDLESPGVGTTLLGGTLPLYGIVDWFVEDALGEGDRFLSNMVEESSLGQDTSGHIAVVPAFGTETGDYLSKLGRVYLERGPNGHESWSERLKRLVAALETQETPDVVLLDSRTGLHDTSAALVLAMGANTLCFAVDTQQTWAAYRFLFQHWQQHHQQLADFRDKLWILGAMVPSQQTQVYVDGLRDKAWDLFRDHFYETANPQDTDAFSYSAEDEAGNHYPRLILWQQGLMAFDPLDEWTDQLVTAAYQGFLDWFDQVMLPEPAGT
ncbi:AAA family ATPase [Lamprobacter modestohalophilus]|uniref:KGGVGR-motif variant AAA ATPase n=1 Tax=Lamprobacter modestohalophilus TaxID=1064514 RepID=UPI002ADED531|nr:AAA family ATPase [Lamprobacter modestohalophilus]MEA1050844.1 AAA family ATPase [Lamprobacter modestohalophilus]